VSHPVLTIIAGSNGCGKSTLTSSAREKFQQTPVLDPDAIAKSIQEALDLNKYDIEAGKQVLRRAEELIAEKQSFTVETTLSGSTYLRMATRAKDAGIQHNGRLCWDGFGRYQYRAGEGARKDGWTRCAGGRPEAAIPSHVSEYETAPARGRFCNHPR
jgi:Zeta toxin